MSSSKLVRVLATLSKNEWQSLTKYLRVYNREESDHFRLFEKISKKQKEVSASFDLAKIKNKNFSKLNDKSFGNLQSRLYKEVCNWLSLEQFKQKEYATELSLLKAFNDRGLYKDADSVASKLENRINADTKLNLNNNEALRNLLHYQYYSDNPIKYELKRDLLKSLVHCHGLEFQQRTLQYTAEMYNWGSIKKLDYSVEIKMFEDSIQSLPDDDLSHMLGKIVMLTKSKNLGSLKSVYHFIKNENIEVRSELHTLTVMYLISYCLNIWMKGGLDNTDIILELYEYGLSSNALMKSGKIPQLRFYNILSTIGAIKEFAWTKRFILRWYKEVETENYDSLLALSNAYNCFYHNNYEDMIPYLQNVKFEILDQKVRSLELLMIGMYKDEKFYDLLEGHILNLKRTLKRGKNKMSIAYYKSHYNLTEVIHWLAKRKYGDEKLNLDDFEYLIYRRWCKTELSKIK